MLDYSQLEVGQQVGIVSNSHYPQGVYTVIKSNKRVLVVRRNSDQYERTFSSKTRAENTTSSSFAYQPHVVELDVYNKNEARRDIAAKQGAVRREISELCERTIWGKDIIDNMRQLIDRFEHLNEEAAQLG